MADIGYMRSKISQVYPYPKWTERVKWMPDNQVMAIYYKFRDEGRFDGVTTKKQEKKIKVEIPKEQYVQMSIWDLLGGIPSEFN